jgi:hypothetical protein
VYVHVISSGPSGQVPDHQIAYQMDVLNAAFAAFGVSFTLVSIDRTSNDSWFNRMTDGSPAEGQAKNALRMGSADDLNLYTTNVTGTHPGWSSFPWEYTGAPKDDGVVVGYGTLPGGTSAPYNLGDTAVPGRLQ